MKIFSRAHTTYLSSFLRFWDASQIIFDIYAFLINYIYLFLFIYFLGIIFMIQIAKQSADLSRVQAALIEERDLKRIEMADYERRVKESLDIEMQIIMAKMTTFFDSKMDEYDQKQKSKHFFDKKLLEEILSPRDDVENAEMIKIQIQ